MAKNNPIPGDSRRPRPCRTCNGAGGTWVEKKYVDDKGKTRSERVYEVCRTCRGSGNA